MSDFDHGWTAVTGTANNMTGTAVITGTPHWLDGHSRVSFQAIWTGTPNGTFTFQISNFQGDIFNADGHVALVWYTYDEGGRPIWYNAQGEVAGLGTQMMPLWRERWRDGRWAGYTVVGSVRIDVKHPESIELAWELNGDGTWRGPAPGGTVNAHARLEQAARDRARRVVPV